MVNGMQLTNVKCAVTGAFGYSGRYIASRLLAEGAEVVTLTNSLNRRNPFRDRVTAYPLAFHDPSAIARALKGVKLLFNTYWVRYPAAGATFTQAVENSRVLFEAAHDAGVERVVHTSITNPSESSSLGYFRGKAQVERLLRESGLRYAILRPALLFGKEDILVNNIAWILRRFPVFGVLGKGDYRLQPIHVDDFARLCVEFGMATDDVTVDALGPELFTYRELVAAVSAAIDVKRKIISVPPSVGYAAATLMGWAMRDVTLTWEEVQGLMQGLLWSDAKPLGETRLTDWARANRDSLGRSYASEMARRRNREKPYEEL